MRKLTRLIIALLSIVLGNYSHAAIKLNDVDTTNTAIQDDLEIGNVNIESGKAIGLQLGADDTVTMPNFDNNFLIEVGAGAITTITNAGTIADDRAAGKIDGMFEIQTDSADATGAIINITNTGSIFSKNNNYAFRLSKDPNNNNYEKLIINIDQDNELSKTGKSLFKFNGVVNLDLTNGEFVSYERQTTAYDAANVDAITVNGASAKLTEMVIGGEPNITIDLKQGSLGKITNNVLVGKTSDLIINYSGGSITGAIDLTKGLGKGELNIKSGNFNLISDIKVKNVVIDNGATFTWDNNSGKVQVTDSFENDGTLVVAKNGLRAFPIFSSPRTINGNYEQTSLGTLKIVIDETSYGLIGINGDSTFNNSNLYVQVDDPDTIGTGDSFEIIRSQGVSPPAGVNFTIESNDNRFKFLTALNGNSVFLTAYKQVNLVNEAIPSNDSIAAVLDQLSLDPSTPAALQSLINQLDGLNATQLNEALNQLSCESKSNYFNNVNYMMNVTAGLPMERSFNSPLNLATSNIQRFLFDADNDYLSINNNLKDWFRVYANYQTYKPNDAYNGYQTKTWGLVIGQDLINERDHKFGYGAAYGSADIKTPITNLMSSSINSFQVFLYNLFQKRQVCVDVALSGAYNRLSATRNINIGDISGSSKASYNGWGIANFNELGYLFEINNTNIKPFAAVNLSYVTNNPYTEVGVLGTNLAVKKQDQFYAKFGGGLELSHNWYFENSALMTYLRYAMLYNSSGNQQNVVSSFVDTSPTFITTSEELGKTENDINFAIKYLTSSQIEFSFSYSYMFRKLLRSQSAFLELKYSF